MPFLDWSSTFSVGVDAFDNEHKRLLALMNKLYDSILDGSASDGATREIVDEVIAYSNYHFSHEERVLEFLKFPDLMQHRHQHELLRTQVVAFKHKLDRGGGISVELSKFLIGWVLEHILKDDMQYRDFLKSKDVQ
jgi:hemerythrin